MLLNFTNACVVQASRIAEIRTLPVKVKKGEFVIQRTVTSLKQNFFRFVLIPNWLSDVGGWSPEI